MFEIVAAPVIGGLVGFLVWFLQNRISKIQAECNDLMDKRREVYADLLEPFIRIHAGPQDPAEIAGASEQLKSLDFKRKAFQFSLLAEDSVIRAFNDIVEYIESFGDQSIKQPALRGFVWVEHFG